MKIKREKSTSTKGHYVTNATLLPVVIEAKRQGKITDELIRMLWMIAERYSRKSWFIGYSYREDMVSAAVLNLCHNNNALKFNPERSPSPNPFSYYTTAINNVFSQFKADEKKHRNIRDALLIDAGSNPSFNYTGNQEDATEVKTSDDMIITDADPHKASDNLPYEKPVPDAPAPVSRHPKWAAREPGPVTTYTPDQYDVDPVTGKVTIKPKPEPVPEPAKVSKKKSARKAMIKLIVKHKKTKKTPRKPK